MGVLDYRDKVRVLVEQKPVQPAAIAKELNTNSILASAMLAEMSEKGLVKVSSMKVGSSPLYYHPDHPEHLLNYIENLNEKDGKTVNLLQEKGVLRDSDQDPLVRVSLRNVKDFAKPLDVTLNNQQELFWKFYLLSDEDAAGRIKQLMSPPAQEAPKPEAPAPKPKKPRKPRVKKPKPDQQQLAPAAEAPAPEKPAVPAPAAPAAEPAKPAESQPAAAEPATAQQAIDDPFLQQVMSFFAANNITVLEQIVLKKKTEYDFVVQLQSQVGQLNYYCKAKKKKSIAESDLSHAFVQGQLKKLPVLFLTPGSLSKSAQELLKELKGLTVKKVE